MVLKEADAGYMVVLLKHRIRMMERIKKDIEQTLQDDKEWLEKLEKTLYG